MPSSYHVKRCLRKRAPKNKNIFWAFIAFYVSCTTVCARLRVVIRNLAVKKRRAESADVSGDSLQSYTPQGGFFSSP